MNMMNKALAFIYIANVFHFSIVNPKKMMSVSLDGKLKKRQPLTFGIEILKITIIAMICLQ